MLKIKCNDGIVRRFQTAKVDGDYLSDGTRFQDIGGSREGRCLECGELFGVCDTRVLKPIWRKHTCKGESS